MSLTTQTKAEGTICSSIGDIEKHERFKKLSKTKRIEKLQEVYDKYGVRSKEFFIQVKPFIMWAVYKHLRGMPAALYLEDLVNNAYEELIIAFEGGLTTHYNKEVDKLPLYQSEKYYKKWNNIGSMVLYVVGSSVSKYRSKNYKRQSAKEDTTFDISERVGFTNFEEQYDLYDTTEINYTKYFSHFRFNDAFIKHLQFIKHVKPKNNILFNFMLWQEKLSV